MNSNTHPTPVMGYLAQNWPHLNDQTPAVVINPAAKPLDLMAWCWAELKSMQAAADVLAFGDDAINKSDLSALVNYRIEPLVTVFEQAMAQLISDEKRNGGV